MRELIFRGKSFKNGKWVQGLISYGYDNNKNPCMVIDDEEIDEKTIGQYTGLNDKNGNKIFEGDIVEEKKHISIVKWDDSLCSYVTFTEKLNHITNLAYYYKTSKLEVIGNIYDNPEILEEK